MGEPFADPGREPVKVENGAHGICRRAQASSFLMAGRIGIWICQHKVEAKVSFGIPPDAAPAEVELAYEIAKAQEETIQMAARGAHA